MIENTHPGLKPAEPLRNALGLALVFALVKLALHVASNLWEAHLGWGYFRDEPYYIMCGRFLDWGYVDHGPIVALQARLTILLFGKSLAGIRMLTALAGAGKVLLTGLLGWQLGARRTGQALAMASVLLAPEYLGLDSFLSMNSFEPVFWMTTAFALMRLVAGSSSQWWIVFGVAAGIGCENKPSMVFFLAAIFLGLLITPQRRIFFTRAMLIGVAIAFLLVLPNILWQYHHHWATLRFLHRAGVERRFYSHLALSPPELLAAQVFMLNPISLPLWGGGLVWLLKSERVRPYRFLGFTYLIFVVLMIATRDAKEYYLAPIYPVLFAAGGMAWEALLQLRRMRWLVPSYVTVLVISSLLMIPLSIPILRPRTWLAYVNTMHMRILVSRAENDRLRDQDLPWFFVMRFDQQELTDDVTRIYQSLSPADRAKAGIFCTNFGEASAINFFGDGRGLPFAISGHNNYFIWGPHGETGAVMIVVAPYTREQMLLTYKEVTAVGRMDHPYVLPGPQMIIYVCRDRKSSLVDDWPGLRLYD